MILAAPPGMGKTRLALDALYGNVKGTYRWAAWLRGTSLTQLDSSIERLADEVGIPPGATPPETLRRLMEKAAQPCLVVFDDVPSPDVVEDYVEATGAADIVLTTSTGVGGDTWRVPPLGPEPDVLSFISRKSGLVEADAADLLEAVDGVPLFVLHACHYIAATSASLSDYLGLLQRPATGFETTRDFLPADYYLRDRGVIPLNVKRLQEMSPAWRDLLMAIAALDDVPIPLDVLRAFDDAADGFLAEARASFTLSIDRSTGTCDVPTLVRFGLREHLQVDGIDPGLRGRLYASLDMAVKGGLSETALAYVGQHLAHLGADGGVTLPALRVVSACDGAQLSLVSEMYELAYAGMKCGGRQDADWSDACANIASSAAWSLYRQRRLSEAEALIWPELESANRRGSLTARADLLHILGHVLEGARDEDGARRAFLAAAAATRATKGPCIDLGQLLADVLYRASQDIQTATGPERERLMGEAASCLSELEELQETLVPAAAAGVTAADREHWEHSRTSWLEAAAETVTNRYPTSDTAHDQAPGSELRVLPISEVAPSFAREAGANATVPMDFVEAICRMMEDAETHGIRSRDATEASSQVDIEVGKLRRWIDEQWGIESIACAVPEYLAMVNAHRRDDGQEAARCCREFSRIALARIHPLRWLRYLVAGVMTVPVAGLYGQDWESHLAEGASTLLQDAAWLAFAPEVEALVWLIGESVSSGESPNRASVRRAARAILAMEGMEGRLGRRIAGEGLHALAHREDLTREDALRYHRLSVGLQRVVRSRYYATATYCYAHQLLAMDKPDAATRRFREAREFLAAIDGRGKLVEHIDAHLSSPIAPFLAGEVGEELLEQRGEGGADVFDDVEEG